MALKQLTELRGPSGGEGPVREWIVERARPLCDELRVDRLGSVIAHKRGTVPGAGRVLMTAHMDEVALIVVGIEDDGLLHYAPVGGIDARVMVSKRVLVGEKAVPGVIGAKAIHLQSKAELAKPLSHDDLSIDIGAKDKAAAEALVSPGDYATFDSDYVEFGEGLVKAKALDDRAGCWNLLRLLEGTYPVDLTCAFTVQEEVGLRGGRAAGYAVEADCAIALEATAVSDLGDEPEHLRVGSLGAGVALSFMDRTSIAHPGLLRALRELAEKKGIPWQVKKFVSGGNEAGALQGARGGVPACVLSVPCRYIHSPASVASLGDIDRQYALARAFLEEGAKFSGEERTL